MNYRVEENANSKYVQMLEKGWEPDATMTVLTVRSSNTYTKTTWRILNCPEGLKVFSTSMGKSNRRTSTTWVADIANENELSEWRTKLSSYGDVEENTPSP